MMDTKTLRNDLEVAAALARGDNKLHAAVLYRRAADYINRLELALYQIAGHANITAERAREVAAEAVEPKGDIGRKAEEECRAMRAKETAPPKSEAGSHVDHLKWQIEALSRMVENRDEEIKRLRFYLDEWQNEK